MSIISDDSLVVYTVIMGTDYDLPHTIADKNVCYICFTDNPDLAPNGWTLKFSTPTFPGDIVRSSREQKIRAHRWLGNFTKSIYIDSSVQLKVSPTELWDYLMPDITLLFGAFHHSFRDTIEDEFREVFKAGLDDTFILAEQIESYEEFHPSILQEKPIWGGLLARRHNDPGCIEVMEEWFANVIRYSRRDQLSLPFALSKIEKKAVRLVSCNILKTEFHKWPRRPQERPANYYKNISGLLTKHKKIEKYFISTEGSNDRIYNDGGIRAKDASENSIRKPEAQTIEFEFDNATQMFFVTDILSKKTIYVSDPKRLYLYTNGISTRVNSLLNDYRIPRDLIENGDTVIDVGANNGELGVWAQTKGANYMGFEPDPNAFKALQVNVGESSAYQVAISSRNGIEEFFLNTENADSSLFKPSSYDETIVIKTQTLDAVLLSINALKPIKLLKIEAEGMEPEVLAGATLTLCLSKYVAIDSGPERGGTDTAAFVINELLKYGFEIQDCFLQRGTFFLRNLNIADKRAPWKKLYPWFTNSATSRLLYFLSKRSGVFSMELRQKLLLMAQKRSGRATLSAAMVKTIFKQLPLDFDYSIYRKYHDLSGMSDKELKHHWLHHGQYEGRNFKKSEVLPYDFVHNHYRLNYEDLISMTDEELEQHWLDHGRYEGRNYR